MLPQSTYADSLVLCRAFENYWNIFSQTEGAIYSTQCRDAAAEFSQILRTVLGDVQLRKGIELKFQANRIHTSVDDAVEELRNWPADRLAPHGSINESRVVLFAICDAFAEHAAAKLGATLVRSTDYDAIEGDYRPSLARWSGRMKLALANRPPQEILNALQSRTITVVGDIRRSQDLMTYAESPDAFMSNLMTLMDKTVASIKSYRGVFDKFTGDGFIAHFNEEICGTEQGHTYIDSFLGFSLTMLEKSRALFADWVKSVRKVPPEPIGIALGADIGNVAFRDVGGQLFAVGSSIVWASRMASAARANELFVNNVLSSLITRPGVTVSDRPGSIKGEEFLARVVKFSPPSPPPHGDNLI